MKFFEWQTIGNKSAYFTLQLHLYSCLLAMWKFPLRNESNNLPLREQLAQISNTNHGTKMTPISEIAKSLIDNSNQTYGGQSINKCMQQPTEFELRQKTVTYM